MNHIISAVFFTALISGAQPQISPIVVIETIAPEQPAVAVDPNRVLARMNSNDPIILECQVDKKPQGTVVQWSFFRQGDTSVVPISSNELSYDDSRWKIEPGITKDNAYRLTLKNPTLASQGRYECSVYFDDNSDPKEASKFVEIIADPVIIPELSSTDREADVGGNVELKCIAKGIPEPEVVWERAGKAMLPNGGEYHNNPTLTIQDIKPEDGGEYICKASNKAGSAELSITINLSYPPKISITKAQQYQKIGYKADLICDISAKPIPREDQVIWSKDGQIISTEGRFKVVYTYGIDFVTSSLSILGVQSGDYGTYKCQATAKSTTTSAEITLLETDKATPDKRGLIVYGSSASTVTMAWSLIVPSIILSFSHCYRFL